MGEDRVDIPSGPPAPGAPLPSGPRSQAYGRSMLLGSGRPDRYPMEMERSGPPPPSVHDPYHPPGSKARGRGYGRARGEVS